MLVKATAKNVRISPQKARLAVDLIRGKSVARALEILEFGETKAAGLVLNCLLYTSPSPRDLSTSRMPSSA